VAPTAGVAATVSASGATAPPATARSASRASITTRCVAWSIHAARMGASVWRLLRRRSTSSITTSPASVSTSRSLTVPSSRPVDAYTFQPRMSGSPSATL
jgi:hypothetical protein